VHPNHNFCFILGTDQLANLQTWKHWQSLFDYARIGVVDRDQLGAFVVPDVLKQHQAKDRLFRIPMPRIAVSSTDIRRQFALAASASLEIRETALHRLKAGLPPPVLEYLKANPVYGRLLG
jgi:nicotinic acid mononucleotide adenylyltransferase